MKKTFIAIFIILASTQVFSQEMKIKRLDDFNALELKTKIDFTKTDKSIGIDDPNNIVKVRYDLPRGYKEYLVEAINDAGPFDVSVVLDDKVGCIVDLSSVGITPIGLSLEFKIKPLKVDAYGQTTWTTGFPSMMSAFNCSDKLMIELNKKTNGELKTYAIKQKEWVGGENDSEETEKFDLLAPKYEQESEATEE